MRDSIKLSKGQKKHSKGQKRHSKGYQRAAKSAAKEGSIGQQKSNLQLIERERKGGRETYLVKIKHERQQKMQRGLTKKHSRGLQRAAKESIKVVAKKR